MAGFINTFSSYLKETTNTYSENEVNNILSQFSLSSVNSNISASAPHTVTGKGINYNWYDSSLLFVNPNSSSLAQKIKDIESQYYYLSGELLYSSLPTGFQNCQSYYQTINTSNGPLTFQAYVSTPCFSGDSYVGPVSGIKFYRAFSDGPASSGKFTPDVLNAYANFDQKILDPRDSSPNTYLIYSREVDANGNKRILK